MRKPGNSRRLRSSRSRCAAPLTRQVSDARATLGDSDGDATQERLDCPAAVDKAAASPPAATSAITHDGNGQLFNTNADTISAEIGKALAKEFDVKISYCFELPGVMKDIKDSSTLIRKITKKSYQNLLFNNIISEGMMPKLHNAIEAIEGGVNEVAIGNTNMINQDIPYTSITLR